VAEQDGRGDGEPIEKTREHLESLAMHETRCQRAVERIRAAVSLTVIDQSTPAESSAQRGRKVAPSRDGSEAFVEEDDRRRRTRGRAVPLVLQSTAIECYES